MPNTILKRWNGSSFEELYPKTTVTQISATGTANNTTFLRGDGAWQIPATQSHTHGNILNNGTITAAAVTIESGDTLLIANNNNSQLIERGIAFATGTTTFLRNDGQWATPAGGGNVSGPGSSTTGNVPRWNDETGTILNAGLAVIDSTSASALSTNTGLVTERDVYYGTPTINNSKTYTSSTNIYAPSTGGGTGQILVSSGSTTAPVWANITAETEWELIRSVYSTSGTTIDPLSGNSPLSITGGMEYKVVFTSHTTGEDNDGVTIQFNGITTGNYTWVFHRTQITAGDTATITASADSSGATFINTGTFLNSFSSTGVSPNTITRVEFTIAPWDTISSSNYFIAVQGNASSVFSAPGATSGNAVTNFSGSFAAGINVISNCLITHNQGAGATDKASAYVYQRARGY